MYILTLHGGLTSNFSFGRYDNKLRVEYKIRCQQNEVAYYNMTYLDIQGRDCEDSDGRMVYVLVKLFITVLIYMTIIMWSNLYSAI